jgi:two-component system chemotaxis response regulator CheY
MGMQEILQEVTDDIKYNGLKEDGSAYRIVIADDAVFIRNSLNKILTSVGYDVVACAENGQQAVDFYFEHKPDLITLDITMPIMEGTDAIVKIMEQDPAANVVMVSAMGYRDLVKECIIKGAKNFVVKPIKPDNVKKLLEICKHSITG